MEIEVPLQAFAYERVTVAAAVTTLTAATLKPSGEAAAQAALITVQTASCRFRCDGGDAAPDIGHLLSSGDSVLLYGLANLVNFSAYRNTGTSAELMVTYLR